MTAIIVMQFCLLLADTMYASYHHTDASGHVLQGAHPAMHTCTLLNAANAVISPCSGLC